MWRIGLFALAACASYRALPLRPPPRGASELTLRYEQKKFQVFTSIREDARIEGIFASGNTIVAVVSQPQDGVFVSSDGGADWTFAGIDDRFRDVLFDGPLIVGRGSSRLRCSSDGGKSWRAWGDGPLDAAAVAGGAIYAASAGHLYVSQDCAQSWRTLTPQIPPGWRARSIAADGRNIYLSVSVARERPPLATLLDASSEAAVAALSFVDGRATKASGEGAIWATHDGGTLWQRTPLALEAWLAILDGQIWAVAADPMIEGATLVRRAPEMAAALDGQLRGARVDASAVRASFAFPGREKLLHARAAPTFRSIDEGVTWTRLDDAPMALQAAVHRQRTMRPLDAVAEGPRRPEAGARSGGGRGGGSGGRYGRRGDRGAPPQDGARQPLQRSVASETFLVLLDPLRLLARFNSGRPLTGIAGDWVLHAYVPTQRFWDSLVDALVAQTDAEGEIALGGGRPGPGAAPDGAFELLFSADGGATWSDLPAPAFDPSVRERGILPYPLGIAAAPPQALVVFSGIDRTGQGWRDAWRWAP